MEYLFGLLGDAIGPEQWVCRLRSWNAAGVETRSPERRKADASAKITATKANVWIASGSPTGGVHLVPVTHTWNGSQHVLTTEPRSRTVANVTANPRVRLALGETRDVVMVDAVLIKRSRAAEASEWPIWSSAKKRSTGYKLPPAATRTGGPADAAGRPRRPAGRHRLSSTPGGSAVRRGSPPESLRVPAWYQDRTGSVVPEVWGVIALLGQDRYPIRRRRTPASPHSFRGRLARS